MHWFRSPPGNPHSWGLSVLICYVERPLALRDYKHVPHRMFTITSRDGPASQLGVHLGTLARGWHLVGFAQGLQTRRPI